MNVFFLAIGGAGLSPLALIAQEAGFHVSGSNRESYSSIEELKKRGITDIYIGSSKEQIARIHEKNPIDWLIYSSAIPLEDPNSVELKFARDMNIKTSKRDEFINFLVQDKKLQIVAISGTHGKTTTTSMVVWLFKQLGIKVSYLIGGKIEFGPSGQYQPGSSYFVIEADEFDRNFLSFEPYLSLISGVSWDHHEIFPTREDYQQAFREFIEQSKHTFIWEEDSSYLGLDSSSAVSTLKPDDPLINSIKLNGKYNRQNAYLAIKAVAKLTDSPTSALVTQMDKFPGLGRRMEEIVPNLYSDYAHTPEKIRAAMNAALELASKKSTDVVVVYEPLTNRRQHYIKDLYQDSFKGVKAIYWVPSYLAREDPDLEIIESKELIARLSDPSVAKPALLDAELKERIKSYLSSGDMVVAMSGGGPGGLDEWLRREFSY
ncbi:MAG TPA: Mur ligase domain-containing protein [Candidatus Saccharimonadales bacterium]|nr:Mur ligase domain-containing protein [Candidatus Saccharimonadales bacterium]